MCGCVCVCVCVCVRESKADKPTDTAEKGDKAVKTEKVVEKAEILKRKKYSRYWLYTVHMCTGPLTSSIFFFGWKDGESGEW